MNGFPCSNLSICRPVLVKFCQEVHFRETRFGFDHGQIPQFFLIRLQIAVGVVDGFPYNNLNAVNQIIFAVIHFCKFTVIDQFVAIYFREIHSIIIYIVSGYIEKIILCL